MSEENSSLKVIHWEQNPSLLDKPVELQIEMGVSGAWIESTAILHFRWRIMGYTNSIPAIHLLAENNFPITDLSTFDEATMKAFVFKSQVRIQGELSKRLQGLGEVFLTDTSELLSDKAIKRYCGDFKAVMRV